MVRSFSKSRSLAGLRLGYALGQTGLIDGLQRVKNSFNSYPIDRLACRLGVASIADEDYFRESIERVIASRERLGEAGKLYRELKAAGILVRYFDRPRIDDCLRISIGSDADCDALLETLQNILA